MAIEIADIITEFGNYYINQGQNMTRVVKQLNQRSETEELFTTVVTDDTVWRGAQASIDRVLQPFQKAWTPISTLTLTPEEIRQYRQKIDFEGHPDDLEATWLGFLTDNELDRKAWPFVRWFIEEHLIPKSKEDYELSEVFAGEYAAPTPGTAGAAGTSMNGVKTIINNHVTSGRITPITMGAIPTDKTLIVKYFEDFADQINDKYWGIPMEVGCSKKVLRDFSRGYRELYGKDTDYSENTSGKVDMTNLTLKGVASHNGSDKIWATPKSNAVRLVKKTQNMNRVRVENVDRLLKMYSDFSSGVGFIIPEVVFTNDQDLAVV